MKQSRLILLMITCLCLLSGCAGVASMADFSKTAETLDFDKLSQANYESQEGIWNIQTEYEFFIEVEKIEEDALLKAMMEALIESGYELSYVISRTGRLSGKEGYILMSGIR